MLVVLRYVCLCMVKGIPYCYIAWTEMAYKIDAYLPLHIFSNLTSIIFDSDMLLHFPGQKLVPYINIHVCALL